MLVDYDRFRKITWILYGLGMIPLLMIFFKSALPSDLIVEFNDVARAVNVPLIGALQPAEFFKIILTMTLAHIIRSEEHTSELQSRGHLVCRLLLENKK